MDLWDWEMDEFFNRGNAFDLLTDETLCTNCQFSFGSRPWKETSPASQRADDIFPRRSQVLGNEKWFSSNLQVDDVHFKRLSDTKAFNQFVAAPTICCCAFLRTVKIDASRGIFNFFFAFACEQHHLICRTLNKVYCFLWKLLASTDKQGPLVLWEVYAADFRPEYPLDPIWSSMRRLFLSKRR